MSYIAELDCRPLTENEVWADLQDSLQLARVEKKMGKLGIAYLEADLKELVRYPSTLGRTLYEYVKWAEMAINAEDRGSKPAHLLIPYWDSKSGKNEYLTLLECFFN